MISDRGLELIKQFEGCRLEAYPDPGTGGKPWTIGYGHTHGVHQGQKCTQEEADAWLRQDAQEACMQVLRAIKVRLTQNQLDALTSFVFNVGIGNFKSSTLLKRLNDGDFEGAGKELLRWNKAAGKVLPGLVRRREAEKQLFEEPMAPFLLAALPSLIQAAPQLIRAFGDSPQSEKNAQAAEVVASIAKEVTQQPTIEGAVQVIQADPQKAAEYREQVFHSMSEILTAAQVFNDMEQKNISAAREHNNGRPLMFETKWVKLEFIHALSIAFVSFSGWFVSKNWDSLTAELKGAVITLMVIAGWNGVRDYWMGSSSGSQEKTRELVKK